MDELEKKEDLEQEAVQTEPGLTEIKEGPKPQEVEQTASEEQTNEQDAPEAAKVGEEPATEEKKKDNEESNYVVGIIVGLAVFVAVLVTCWMLPGSEQNTGVLYAKENNLYFYDLENDPYLLQEGISEGGSYHYFYTAWGAGCAEEGKWAYFSDNIDETGAFDLYRKDAKDSAAAAELIDSNVYDYVISKDGEVAAYLKEKGEAMEICTFDGTEVQTIGDGIHLENEVYALSGDGKYLVFMDAYGMLNAAVVGEGVAHPLTDAAQTYAIAENSGILYFVAGEGDSYTLYGYAFDDSEPMSLAENIYTMEMMPNGEDVLYCKTPEAPVLYSDIIVDDMAEADAALTEADGEAYEKKLQRDEIRKAIADGEGFEPLLQECYVLTEGRSVLIADDVISAISVEHDNPYVTGYKAKEFTPLHLSVIDGGLDMVEYIYYMSLSYGGMETFLADAAGNLDVLTGNKIQPDSMKVSGSGKYASYLASDPDTEEIVLMEMEFGKPEAVTVLQRNVKSFDYLGKTEQLSYYFDYADGKGSISLPDGSVMENTCGVQYAKDKRALYYIENPDDITGNGVLRCWKSQDHQHQIDEDVFAFQYKGNGRLVYFKNYDVNTGLGDLYYFDGASSRLLDTGVTAIFIY